MSSWVPGQHRCWGPGLRAGGLKLPLLTAHLKSVASACALGPKIPTAFAMWVQGGGSCENSGPSPRGVPCRAPRGLLHPRETRLETMFPSLNWQV